MKEQQEELLEQGRKEGREDFFTKNRKHFRYPGCPWVSSRHAIQVGVSEIKIISLYIKMVSLMASSSSSFVFIQFRRGIFNFFASSNRDVLFIYD